MEKQINMNINRNRNTTFRSKKRDRTSQVYILPFRKIFFRKRKTIKDQGEKEIKSTEDHGKQLVESIALVKKIIMILKVNYF